MTETQLMTVSKRVGMVALMCLSVAGLAWLSTVMSKPSAPDRARRTAVAAVERQYSTNDATVWAAARSGNCIVVQVQRREAESVGPSVSLIQVDGQWKVRNIGDDFTTHTILKHSKSVCL